jgi:NAD-dependent dihydropyrimidine dehydrogenase PreA subunit
MAYVVTEACVDLKDKSCVRECPVDCIYEGDRQMYINPSECIDCGACEPVCPHDAIFYEGDLEPEDAHIADRQATVFLELGRLGGARKYGQRVTDPAEVAGLSERGHSE